MAFDPDGLQRIGGANSDSRAVWVYASADTAATVTAADYFLDRITEMKLLDIVIIVDTAGVVTISYVATNNGTTIDLGVGSIVASALPAAYTPTNVTTDRAFDADTVVVSELADVVGTMIADLQAAGIFQ